MGYITGIALYGLLYAVGTKIMRFIIPHSPNVPDDIEYDESEKGEWDPAAEMAEAAESVIKKYSNGRYDHNIDALYDAYIEAKKKYKEVGDQGHRDKLMECVCRLMTEVYDMLSSMVLDSDFSDERKAIERQVKMLAEM